MPLSRASGRLALKFCSAYATMRAIRQLQRRGVLPGEGGMAVGSTHLHHYLYGFGLLTGQQVLGAVTGAPVSSAVRSNALCIGAALVVDEFDVLLGCEDSAWAGHRRPLVDAVLATGALALAYAAGTRTIDAAIHHWRH